MPATLVILALLVAWQLAVDLLHVKEYILPSPWSALKALDRPTYRWLANFLTTLYAVLGAFVLSAILGIALAPLFILWLGYGIWPNIVIGTTIAFFPMVVNTAIGLASAEPEILDLVRTLRATRWQVFAKIRFPNAIPYIFAGLKLNATMSVTGAIVGEFVASELGLGALIISAGVTLETQSIFASLMLISLLGLALYGLVVLAEQLVAPWAQREDAQT